MNPLDIDWNEVWKGIRADKHTPVRDTTFWDKRAPEFTRHATASDYIGQFVRIMQPEPSWTVLDVGCAAGTLAVPLAASVRRITALDASGAMIALLDERCRTAGIDNIRTIHGRWEDDWDELDITSHDVVIASRSLIIDDLQGAIVKLRRYARRRIYLSTLVDDGPYDRAIVEAVGRQFRLGADYIIVYNLLRRMGIYANVAFTVNTDAKTFSDLDDAVQSLRWMLHDMTPEEESQLREHLAGCLVKENGHWRLPYRRAVRWAVLWWDIQENGGIC